MKNRKAFDIKNIQLVYNTLHLLINFSLFALGVRSGWFNGYSFRCQACDVSEAGKLVRIFQSDKAAANFTNLLLQMSIVSWCYFISKFTDFFETFIFILGKRFDLVNTYHVAHHSIMPVSVWWGVKFLPGGHATFFGFLNTFVHIVIYSYLVVIAAFPKVKPYFGWWKTFLPIFQVVQFAMIFIHSFQLFVKNECNFPMEFVYFIGGHGVLFYFVLMYELVRKVITIFQRKPSILISNSFQKWNKSSSKQTAKTTTVESRKEVYKNKTFFIDNHNSIVSKNFDTVFNYDSFIRVLSSKKEKAL
jgi:elongation of very long chain fatty acids protein 7